MAGTQLLFLDTETYSEVSLSDGTANYTDACEIIVITYMLESWDSASVWDATDGSPPPADLIDFLNNPEIIIVCHNAFFDRLVLVKSGLVPPVLLPIKRFMCNMAKAYAHSLPGGLGKLGDIVGLAESEQKIKDGKRLIHAFCKPQGKRQKIRRRTRLTHPEDWQKFLEYARVDTEAMKKIWYRIPGRNYRGIELAVWHLDQRINDRGVQIDLDLCRAMTDHDKEFKKMLADKTYKLTHENVAAATQRDKMLDYLNMTWDLALPDLRTATLNSALERDIPQPAKELINIRLESTRTSVAKYKKFLSCVSPDGRLRGSLQFGGAMRTCRWAGRYVQLQNLPRPDYGVMKAWGGEIKTLIDAAVPAFKNGYAPYVFDSLVKLSSLLIRSAIIAAPGKKLVVSDLANIEGRVLAWLANERWKLKAFKEYDEGTGHDLYNIIYAMAFNLRVEDVDDWQRQIGKVMELALGYEGGVGAFLTFAAVYGMDLDDLAAKVLAVLTPEQRHRSEHTYDFVVDMEIPTYGLDRHVYVACDALKKMWRENNRGIVTLWRDVESAVKQALDSPGTLFDVRGKLKVGVLGDWLLIRLPSGRCLHYPKPRMRGDQISYMGINSYNRKWQRLNTYGGKLVENITQATARDVMAWAMLRIDSKYPIISTVHDEVITEVPDRIEYSAVELSALLAAGEDWTQGLPLAAKGFETPRYYKG